MDSGLIEPSVNIDGRAHPMELISVYGLPAVPIGLGQQQVPGGVQGIHLVFEIRLGIGIRIDEDLEIIVLEDDAVMLQLAGPDLVPLQHCADVEVLMVPGHLGPGAEPGYGTNRPLDVREVLREGDVPPELLVQAPVQGECLVVEPAGIHRGLKAQRRDGDAVVRAHMRFLSFSLFLNIPNRKIPVKNIPVRIARRQGKVNR